MRGYALSNWLMFMWVGVHQTLFSETLLLPFDSMCFRWWSMVLVYINKSNARATRRCGNPQLWLQSNRKSISGKNLTHEIVSDNTHRTSTKLHNDTFKSKEYTRKLVQFMFASYIDSQSIQNFAWNMCIVFHPSRWKSAFTPIIAPPHRSPIITIRTTINS